MKVFVNCPFDEEYRGLRDAILFTITYLNHEPLISQTEDASESRLDKIASLFSIADASIHDLSRIEFTTIDGHSYPRFNMPLELGLDMGHRLGSGAKRPLCILVGHGYDYQKYISDLNGRDPFPHNNNIQQLIRQLYKFFHANKMHNSLDSYVSIWEGYQSFLSYLSDFFEDNKFDQEAISDLTPRGYTELITKFMQLNRLSEE
jgi:hypothetical protein